MHGFKYEFSKIFWTEPTPQTHSRAQSRAIALDSGFALNCSMALRALVLGFALKSPPTEGAIYYYYSI